MYLGYIPVIQEYFPTNIHNIDSKGTQTSLLLPGKDEGSVIAPSSEKHQQTQSCVSDAAK